MGKYFAGAVVTILLLSAGFFFWIGAQEQEMILPEPPPPSPQSENESGLPEAKQDASVKGAEPPTPPNQFHQKAPTTR